MSASARFPELPSHWSESKSLVAQGKIHVRHWKNPKSKIGRNLLVVHGYGENSNRYRHFPFFLDDLVDSIFAFDLIGHGLSTGARGDCQRYSDYTDTLMMAVNEVLANVPGSCHWFGHSFGGLITLSLMKNSRLEAMKSVIVSAPFLALAYPPPPAKKFFGELIEPILGHLSLKNEIDLGVLSHDPSVAQAYAGDPLNHDRITPRTFVQMTKAQTEIRAWKGPIDKELLVILPLADPLVSAQTTFQFYMNLTSTGLGKKVLQEFPGFFHESFNEKDKSLAFNCLSAWLRAR